MAVVVVVVVVAVVAVVAVVVVVVVVAVAVDFLDSRSVVAVAAVRAAVIRHHVVLPAEDHLVVPGRGLLVRGRSGGRMHRDQGVVAADAEWAVVVAVVVVIVVVVVVAVVPRRGHEAEREKHGGEHREVDVGGWSQK